MNLMRPHVACEALTVGPHGGGLAEMTIYTLYSCKIQL